MLTTETKRHIDSARQILVGVVPNPISQIDQITNALIYKFMDDMDQSAIKMGGEPSFFKGGLEKYAWTKLMDARMGNQERMNLYAEALANFSSSAQLPSLFRDIFKSAFLPFRSPETLGLFLKEIDYFDYTHSEELGNAYEYLLQVMGSQGDAGQFRTPRHIIDFIVEAVNPTKNDKILDPACGTAGFLISAYNHILRQQDGLEDSNHGEKPLTPDERKRLTENIEGYDIDPTMVRMAQVNMYLHQFKNPKIVQYDSLSMDERWNDKFDVILANPPFMSPKGGIKPHSKFSIESTRSEVLFVDYIMNHLKPNGRAGIIVPEGVIFQSGKAYKELRKNLVNNGLYAVVSLPSGVFQPYSGVKTSVLLIDNELAKKNSEILFIKVENDGFDLGAQRRLIAKNDLPRAVQILKKWKIGEKDERELVSYVEKAKICEGDDFNLFGDRYRTNNHRPTEKIAIVKLGDVIQLNFGERITKSNNLGTKYPVYGGGGESFKTNAFNREDEFVIARFAMSPTCIRYVAGQFWLLDSGGTFSVKQDYKNSVSKDYIGEFLQKNQEQVYACARGGAQKNLNNDHFYEIEIPLPSIETQKQIVAELDSYQAIIDGARKIVENWKPRIEIDPEWEKVKIGDVCETSSGGTPLKSKAEYYGGGTIPWLRSGEVAQGFINKSELFISESGLKNSAAKIFPINTVLVAMYGATAGKVGILKFESSTNQAICGILPNSKLLPEFLFQALKDQEETMVRMAGGGAQPNISQGIIRNLEIPLPPFETQKQIVKIIEAERTLVESSRKLIEIYEQKSKEVIEKLWKE